MRGDTRRITTNTLGTVIREMIPGATLTTPSIDDSDSCTEIAPTSTQPYVALSDDQAERWDQGLALCGEAGIDPSSAEGLQVRWAAMGHPGPISGALAEYATRAPSIKRRQELRDLMDGWVPVLHLDTEDLPDLASAELLMPEVLAANPSAPAVTTYRVSDDVRVQILRPVRGAPWARTYHPGWRS